MKAQALSQKYAQAVFSYALEKWLTALSAVQDKLTANAKLVESLQDAGTPFAERQSALDPLIPPASDSTMRNFLYALLKDGNIGLLGEVIADLERMMGGGPAVEVAHVTTALPLSAPETDQFRQQLRTKYGAALEFDFKVDPAILGGAIVQIGDKVIDGSVATRVEAISNALGVRA